MLSASNRPFVTWTFDTHCASMEWKTPPSVPLSATSIAATSSSSSVAVVQDADLIIVGVFAPPTKDDDNNNDEKDEDDKEEEIESIVFTGIAKQLDEELGGALSELANDNSKAFQNGSTAGSMTPALRIASTGGGKTKRCILLGLGAEGKVSKDGTPPKMEPSSIMKVGGAVASAIHDQKKITTCNVLLPTNITQGITTQSMLTDFSTAYYSGLYVDNRYRTGKKIELKAETVQGVTLYLEENNTSDDITTIGQEAIATGLAIASGCALTKDIVNAPHNVLNSESLAETAQRIAAESGGSITCTILGKEECEARGMGAYLGVARGSETEPQFIHLTYKPDGEIK
jgi:leucyl aminopeptidase